MTAISKYFNFLKQILVYLALGIVFIFYIYNQLIGLSLASLVFLVYLVVYIISLSSKRRVLKVIRDYPIISDKEISHKLERPLDDVRSILFSLSKNQKNKKWLIVFLNQRYIFLNERVVDSFKKLYHMGYNEKKILENLQRNTRIKSRAEVKAIERTLSNQNRLNDSD